VRDALEALSLALNNHKVLAMGSMDVVDQLRRRSKTFYEYARVAFERGDYDLSVFMYEQSVQLRLKALLSRLLGFMPRGHGVRELLGILSKTLKELGRGDLASKVDKFVDMWRSVLKMLEEAYTAARYLSKTYERDDAAGIAKLVDSLLTLLEEVEKSVFEEY